MIPINPSYPGMLDRFVRYAKINTRSNLQSESIPTSQGQWDFLLMLQAELEQAGFQQVSLDPEDAYLVAMLPSNLPQGQVAPAIGFVAHVDTADFNAENIQPQVHSNYDGQDVLLNPEEDLWMRVAEFPQLKNYQGQTLITTDGLTLLGADDKAGLVSILEAGLYLLAHPEIAHGDLWFAFGPDEEIGKGAHRFKAHRMPVDFAYTLDSGVVGKLEYETFNAARAQIKIHGTSVHPGQAKDVIVNALAEAAKLFAAFPPEEVPEKTSGYQGFFMLSKQEGNIGFVEAEYIIRDHDQTRFQERKQLVQEIVAKQNEGYDVPRISCHLYDEYQNMYEVLKQDMRPVELAKLAYRACGIEPDIQPFRGGTDGCILTFKGIPCPNLFTGAENLHGQYEFITLESMQKASDMVLQLINLSLNYQDLPGM